MKPIKIALLGLLSLIAATGVVGYTYLKPPAEASGPIQTVAVEQTADPAAGGSTATVFQIDAESSAARFVIDEVLNGSPFTVVGTTDQVAGQIAFDPTDADAARVGTILINARTFATDSTQRDRAIQNRVLQTESHEYVSFTPTALVGLPESATVGQPFAFQIVGDLTIGATTRQVTFDATVTPEAADRLAGSATTTIRYADWGIAIPQVPMVASVSDTLRLELDFAAEAAA